MGIEAVLAREYYRKTLHFSSYQRRFGQESTLLGSYQELVRRFSCLLSLMLILEALLRGDSGSWVVDKIQRTVVGHVVAIANDLAYVISLSQTIDEIKLAYPHYYVQLPSPFQLLVDLAKYNQSKSDEESKVLAKEFASEAISLVLRGLDNLNATAVFLFIS